MGKCKFNEICLKNSAFSAWLKPVKNNPFEARCTLCKKTLKLASLGIKALESHGRSEKHNATLKSQQQTPAITQFCSGSLGASPGPSNPNPNPNTCNHPILFWFIGSITRP